MSLASAFTTAWRDLKNLATKAETWIEKEIPDVQAVVGVASTIVTTVAPALAPVVSTFDTLEETLVGTIVSLASDAATAPSVQALVGNAWPTIQALVTTLSTHPAVVAAKAS